MNKKSDGRKEKLVHMWMKDDMKRMIPVAAVRSGSIVVPHHPPQVTVR